MTREAARRVQEDGPSASWWPGDTPAWARITKDDLVAVDLARLGDETQSPALWRVDAYDDERELATFELCLVDAGVDVEAESDGEFMAAPRFECRDAGVVVKFRDALTFETGDDAQPLAAWFSWLQRRDALAAAQPRSDDWVGDDIEMQLTRAESDVVAMGEQTALLSAFDSVAAVRDWLARLDPRPLAAVEVWAFDVAGWFAAVRGREERSFHQFRETSHEDASQVVVKWLPVPVDATSAASWFALPEGRTGWTSLSGYSGEGGEVSAFAAERAIAWGEMAPFLTEEFDAATPAAARWVAVRFAGMPSGIAMSMVGTFVTWMTDGDGASFMVRGEDADAGVARERAEQDFRLRWCRWYDTDRALSEAELAGGVAAIEARLEQTHADEAAAASGRAQNSTTSTQEQA